MPSTTLDPMFTAVDVPAFSHRHINDIATGSLAAARVRSFFDQAALDSMLTALHRLPTVDYYPVRTAMTRFGPALNDYRDPPGLDAPRYWRDAEAARHLWREVSMEPDPRLMSLDALGDAWGTKLVPATICGRPTFVGMLREINSGTLVHYDDIHLEYPGGLFDQKIVAQLTFNVWLKAPEDGGATTVWRHRWEPADDARRYRYGYRPDVVDGRQHLTLTPALGDALLFNPNNYHMVRPNGHGGRRITLTFFLGVATAGDLVVWS